MQNNSEHNAVFKQFKIPKMATLNSPRIKQLNKFSERQHPTSAADFLIALFLKVDP